MSGANREGVRVSERASAACTSCQNRTVGRLGLLALTIVLLGCPQAPDQQRPRAAGQAAEKSIQALLIEGARDQLTWGTRYDPSYVKVRYPGGDLPRSMGVCTDVLVRAYRHAGIDLQKLIHEDMVKAWAKYPRYSGEPAPDTNIDHRRVPNQRVFFMRHALACSIGTQDRKAWRPGDIVEWKLDNGRDHTGLLTDKLDRDGFPFVIHNIGAGPQEEDVLRSWRIVAHFRYPKKA